MLPLFGRYDTRPNLGGTLGGRAVARQFAEADGRDINMDIDAVEEGAGDASDIALDLQRGTAALARRIIPEPARLRFPSSPQGFICP